MRALPALFAAAAGLACVPAAPPSSDPARHLLLVSVDTLRADRLGAYGYTAASTPHVDALAAESLRFDAAYAHSSMTLPSVTSLLTGRLPAEHGIYANRGTLKGTQTTIAEHLKPAGFVAGAFIGNYALRPTRFLWQGFDRYTNTYREAEQVRKHPENDAKSLTDEAIDWLDARRPEDRFLLWVHYQEPHGPYTPAEFAPPAEAGPTLPQSESESGQGAIPAYQWLGHGRLAEYEARYDGEIAEVDRQLGRLLAAFRERELLGETAVVFTADHGEAFGEEELYCAHGEGLSDALLRVPLLLRAPGVEPGVRGDRVRQIDVLPTLLALLGLQVPELPGRSLLEEAGDRELVAQLVLRDRRWRRIEGAGLSRVDDGAAPLPENDPAAAALKRQAPWPLRLADLQQLTPEEEETLRAMGYAN